MSAIIVPDELDAIIKGTTVLPETALQIAHTFAPMFLEADKAMDDAGTVKVTDAACLAEMAKARKIRLTLKDIRVRAEKAKTAMKSDIVNKGRAIDLVFGHIRGGCEQFEKWLLEQETLPERIEKDRQDKLKVERALILSTMGVDPAMYTLGVMPEADWNRLHDACRAEYDERVEAERVAAEAAKAAAQAKADEDARIRADNERLRQEKVQADAKTAQERRDAQAKIAAANKTAQDAADKARKEREESEERQREAEHLARQKQEEADAKARAAQAAATRKANDAAAKAKAESDAKIAAEALKRQQAESAAGELLAVCGLILERGEQQPDGSVIVRLTKDDAALVAACYRKGGGAL